MQYYLIFGDICGVERWVGHLQRLKDGWGVIVCFSFCQIIMFLFCVQMYSTLKGDAGATTWDISEAALFVMCAIARDISL